MKMTEAETPETALRSRAVERLRKKREFKTHLFVYVVVNAAIVAVWALTGAGFFWPAFPMLGWGIGVIFHGQEAYGRSEVSEEEIRREMERLR